MRHHHYVYILTNDRHTVFYTGVTNDLARPVSEYREHKVAGFTSRHNVNKPVFYEKTSDVRAAIAKEKQIKAGSRHKKLALIGSMNPDWRGLFEDLI